MIQKNVLIEKAREAVDSVLPIALIVSVLCLSWCRWARG